MAIYKNIEINLYKRQLIIFIGNHKEFKDWTNWYYKSNHAYDELTDIILDSDDNAQASFWYNSQTGDNIIELQQFPKTPSEIACMAHETLHATIKILDYVGVEFKQGGSNEAYTYLQEFIIYNILNKTNYKTVQI